MENQADALSKSLEQYEAQLAQIKQTIRCASKNTNKLDLYALEKDLEELISLTRETLNSMKQPSQFQEESVLHCKTQTDSFSEEYALFKAELANLERDTNLKNSENQDIETTQDAGYKDISLELQEDFDKLKGSKCQAPYKQQWGDESYYNALIMDIETNDVIGDLNHIQVRVMFVHPTESNMLPCPYYLDGDCRFSDEKCRFSHGALVPLSDIREYREPDFSSVKKGSQVLAKQKDNLWHRAKVEECFNNNQYLVKFESKGRETAELDLHDLYPLGSESVDDSESSSSDSEEDDFIPQEYFVQLSLLRTPPNVALGAWEKHTKGIGSRLMANMGYVVGCGLGKHGEGRLEPVEATAYPPGKSLDACMALREAAGGDQNMFKAERRQKKQQQHLLRQQQRQQIKQSQKKDVFSFINSKLTGSHVPKPDSTHTSLASSSRKGLNVERFRLGEHMKKIQKDIDQFKDSLRRHEKGTLTHNALCNKLEEAETELTRLQNNDSLVAREQDNRVGREKLAVF